MAWVLYFIAAMTHLTGVQRITRRLKELDGLDTEEARRGRASNSVVTDSPD
jgi:hypothetical protein